MRDVARVIFSNIKFVPSYPINQPQFRYQPNVPPDIVICVQLHTTDILESISARYNLPVVVPLFKYKNICVPSITVHTQDAPEEAHIVVNAIVCATHER